MSDFEIFDVILGNLPESSLGERGNASEIDVYLESRRQQQNTNLVGDNFRLLLNTDVSDKNEITAETSRAINSDISLQISRKLEEIKSYLNSYILEVINSAIEERCYQASKLHCEVGKRLQAQNESFGQMDYVQAKLAKWLDKLRKTFPGS